MGFPMCVPTFGNLRITGYVRLPEAYRSLSLPPIAISPGAAKATAVLTRIIPEAYRSLSRPSSAPDAKAFTMRPL